MLNKKSKLSLEILLIIAICLISSVIVFFILSGSANAIFESYIFNNDIILDDSQFYKIDSVIFISSVIMSLVIFFILFIVLFSRKIRYIKLLIESINDLQHNNYDNLVEIKGNNELTDLAKSINYLSCTTKLVREKELMLNQEKENLIHSLSHDIRTPLTSIISYTEINFQKAKTKKEKEYYEMILKKSNQIKELTDILLDGNKRNVEKVENINLLFIQVVDEFNDMIDEFELKLNLEVDNIPGEFDPIELLRIFDNLSSNIIKYADKTRQVSLNIYGNRDRIEIIQSNYINNEVKAHESYNLGLNIIKRIVQYYEGNVEINKTNDFFEIKISFNKF